MLTRCDAAIQQIRAELPTLIARPFASRSIGRVSDGDGSVLGQRCGLIAYLIAWRMVREP